MKKILIENGISPSRNFVFQQIDDFEDEDCTADEGDR